MSTDLFANVYPLQKNYGSAFQLVKDGNIPLPPVCPRVPRPDCDINTVKWLSILGIFGVDHFFMRSPWTGIVKLLTGGGLGLWWIWDIVQLWFEDDTVLRYGMSTPFDFITGIGQGMFLDGKSEYSQPSSSLVMTLGLLFGFLGISYMLLGKVTVGLRILFIQLFAIPCMYILITNIIRRKFNFSFIFLIFTAIMMMFSLPIFTIWAYNLGGKYEDKVIDSAARVLNLYQKYDKIDTSLAVHGITKAEVREKLQLRHSTEVLNKTVDTADHSEDSPPFMAAPKIIFGMLVDGLAFIIGKVINSTPAGKAASATLGAAGASPLAALGAGANPLAALGKENPLAALGAGASPLAALGKENPLAALGASASPLAASASPPAASASPPAAPSGSKQGGGAREEITVESQILGASVAAIIGGGSIKFLVDYLMSPG